MTDGREPSISRSAEPSATVDMEDMEEEEIGWYYQLIGVLLYITACMYDSAAEVK